MKKRTTSDIAKTLVAAAAVTTLVMGLTPGRAAAAGYLTPSECKAQHLKGDGTYLKGLFKCWAKAAKRGSLLDTKCMNKAFSKARILVWPNTGYGCTGNPDVSEAITRRIEDRTAALLYDPSSHIGNTCASAKLKAVGKYASAVQKLAAKVADSDYGYYEKYLERRAREALKLAYAFEKAEARGTCDVTGDYDDMQADLDADLELFYQCDFELSDGNGRRCAADWGIDWVDLFPALDAFQNPEDFNGWDPVSKAASYDLPVASPAYPSAIYTNHYLLATPTLPTSPPLPAGYVDIGEQVYVGFHRDAIIEPVSVSMSVWAAEPFTDAPVLFFEGSTVPACDSVSPSPDPCVSMVSTDPYVGVVVETSRNGIYRISALP